MSNLNLKGLWIPIEILTDKNLSDKEKHIYSLVIFLSQEKQYCFCTNKTISELLNISVTQVSKLVNSLKDKGYINIEMVYKENSKEVDIRKLIPIEEKLNNTQTQIINLIRDNPSITQKEMSEIIGMALPTIRKNVQILKNKGILIREGATKKGIWIIK